MLEFAPGFTKLTAGLIVPTPRAPRDLGAPEGCRTLGRLDLVPHPQGKGHKRRGETKETKDETGLYSANVPMGNRTISRPPNNLHYPGADEPAGTPHRIKARALQDLLSPMNRTRREGDKTPTEGNIGR